ARLRADLLRPADDAVRPLPLLRRVGPRALGPALSPQARPAQHGRGGAPAGGWSRCRAGAGVGVDTVAVAVAAGRGRAQGRAAGGASGAAGRAARRAWSRRAWRLRLTGFSGAS